MNFYLLIPITLIIIGSGFILYLIRKNVEKAKRQKKIKSTRQIPEVDEHFNVPEEDQNYLAPLMVEILKQLASNKKAYPTNSQLINHLAIALGEASGIFKRWTAKDPEMEVGNEAWLEVAAIAIRLFDEGTLDNADNTREQFMTTKVLAERELLEWAKMVAGELDSTMRKQLGIDESVSEDVTIHAKTVFGSPYTADEIEDLKEAASMKLFKGKDKNK